MARTTNGQKSFIEQARREQIVDAAIDAISESGFAAASIVAIAERIGVSKGVLSYHFAGKSELLREVIGHVLTEAAEYMTPRVAAATSYMEALRIYVTSNLDFIGAHRREIIAFTEIVNGMPPGGSDPPPYLDGHRSAVEDLTRLFEAGQAAGEYRPFSASMSSGCRQRGVDLASG